MITHSSIPQIPVSGKRTERRWEWRSAKSIQASVSIFSAVVFPLRLSPSPHPLQQASRDPLTQLTLQTSD